MGEDTAQNCLHTASCAVGPLGPHVTHAVGTSQQGNNPFAAASLVEGMPRSGFRGMKVEGGLVGPGGTEGWGSARAGVPSPGTGNWGAS